MLDFRRMRQIPLRLWAIAVLSGILQVLPFPIAGPTPLWRTAFCWIALLPLLWALRDFFGLKGTKFGCGAALCGACTVHLDGTAVRSCSTPVSSVGDGKIVTIEAVDGKVADAIRAAWIRNDVPQCGYCQSGQIMQAASLLKDFPSPSDQDIDAVMTGNLCRCMTYVSIRKAIKQAAAELRKGAVNG